MILPDISGRKRSIPISKYFVDWNGKEASKFQFEVKQFFKDFWKSDCVCSEFRIPGTKLRIDLINFTKGIAVEASGEQHFVANKHFHGKWRNGEIGLSRSFARDDKKMVYIEQTLNFQFIELRMKDMKHLDYHFILEKFGVDILEKYV